MSEFEEMGHVVDVSELDLDRYSLDQKSFNNQNFTSTNSGKEFQEGLTNDYDLPILASEWGSEENKKLFKFHEEYGSKWKQISLNFPGRNDNEVKNQFFSIVRKSLRKARRFVLTNQNKTNVNAIKPKVLSNIVFKFLDLPISLISSRESVSEEFQFLFRKPISLKDFVFFFAFSNGGENLIEVNDKVARVVEFILQSLHNQNEEYIRSKINRPPSRRRRTIVKKETKIQLPAKVSSKTKKRIFESLPDNNIDLPSEYKEKYKEYSFSLSSSEHNSLKSFSRKDSYSSKLQFKNNNDDLYKEEELFPEYQSSFYKQ